VLDLCRAQRDAGVDVEVITTTANGDSELPDFVTARHEYEGVPVRYCPRAWPRSIFRAPSLKNAVAESLRTADVLHIHGLWNATVWGAAAAAREASRPYIVSPRGMLATAALAHDRWRKRVSYHVVDGRLIRDAARLHATSRAEFDDLETSWGPGRTVYVPNGVGIPSDIRCDSAIERTNLNLPPSGPIVLFLGRIHPLKRLDLVAAAFRRVLERRPDAHLVIAGPDEEGQRGRVAPLFTPLGPAVTWTGRVADSAKWQLLAAASVLVLCSDSESFGMSAAEAMAAATPVVVTKTCPWREIETHGTGYWVEQSADAIADALSKVLGNEDEAIAMGRRGRALIETHYSWSRAAAGLIDVYRAIAAPDVTTN